MPRAIHLVRPTLFAAALCAANLAVAAQPASAPFTPAQQQAIRQISASAAQAQVPLVASAAAASVAKTIEGEKQAIAVAKDALEVGRKSVDWWLSALGLLMAFAGFGIPFWMGRQQKAEWKERLDEISGKLAEANSAKEKAETAQRHAEQYANEIETLLQTAREKTSLIPNAEQMKGELSVDVLEKMRNEKPGQVVELIKQAWAADVKNDWVEAKSLWSLLSLIESHEANVWFNLAFAEQHSGQDWQQVCEAYQRAHLLQPNAIACYNWGSALLSWSHTLQGEERLTKLAKGEEVLLMARKLGEPNPYNFACLRAVQQRPDEARTLLEETRAAGFLPDFAHLSTDRDLDNLRGLDWFQALLEDVQQQEAASQAVA
ncbi:TPR end-of-group domain-containing protein [Vogesella mureinivorans]|uniref:TPR end-of-group domain-containing protein n=1 Tax=Vogesella mureinivorans TaxID=657276 RepID=UPI0011C731D7|nr:hypothetical protein [Vogesella mureinivorans]